MPNHVDNRLTITGDKAELIRFVSETYEGDETYNFNKLVPLDPRAGKEVRWEKEDGTMQVFSAFSSAEDGFDGYQNAIDMWGTKWGAYDIQAGGAWYELLEKEDYHDIAFYYQSAWSPAGKLIRRISAQFPTLAFGTWYTEEGMGFAGWELYKGGELVGDGDVSLSDVPEYDWESEESENKYHEAMDEVYETLESALHEATMEVMVGQ
jgi:hypothetical protein